MCGKSGHHVTMVDDRNPASPLYVHLYYTTRIPMLLGYIRSIKGHAGFISSTVGRRFNGARCKKAPKLPDALSPANTSLKGLCFICQENI